MPAALLALSLLKGLNFAPPLPAPAAFYGSRGNHVSCVNLLYRYNTLYRGNALYRSLRNFPIDARATSTEPVTPLPANIALYKGRDY